LTSYGMIVRGIKRLMAKQFALPTERPPGRALRGSGIPKLGASVAAVSLLVGAPCVARASEYRLAFITSDTTEAESTQIATYNLFVTGEAALNPNLPTTTWTAIVSTPYEDAATNISCGSSCNGNVPIFLVDGTTEVATSTNALFSGSILNLIDENPNGASSGYGSYVWTGSNSNGTAASGYQLGYSNPVTGWNYYTSDMINIGFTYPDTDSLQLYAISGVLNTASATPLPAALPLFATGLGALGLFGWRRKRKTAAMPRATA
jgi:hypothetical protein